MSFYQPSFSEISLSIHDLKILHSFADESLKEYNPSFLPLLDVGLLEYRNVPFKKGSIATISKVTISRKGQLYLKYLSKKRSEKFLLIGTFVASVLAVIISLVK